MLLRGQALIGAFTLDFSVHGEPGEWALSIKGPNRLVLEQDTAAGLPYALLNQMLETAAETCRRNFTK